MTDERKEAAEPISASADGKRNAWCLSCPATNQKMNYAACLNRIEFIDKPEVRAGRKVPKDWNDCDRAPGRHERGCVARSMRIEEEAAGKAIYFVARSFLATLAASASKWVMERVGKATTPAAATKVKKDMFAAMGEVGSMADVASAVAAAAAMPRTMTAVKPERTPPKVLTGITEGLHPSAAAPYVRKTLPVAAAGESPLQMARRLAAEKATK